MAEVFQPTILLYFGWQLLNVVPDSTISHHLVQVMIWCWSGDNPSLEPKVFWRICALPVLNISKKHPTSRLHVTASYPTSEICHVAQAVETITAIHTYCKKSRPNAGFLLYFSRFVAVWKITISIGNQPEMAHSGIISDKRLGITICIIRYHNLC